MKVYEIAPLFFTGVDCLFRHACNHLIVERLIRIPQIERICLCPVHGLPHIIILIHLCDEDEERILADIARKHLFAELVLLEAWRVQIEARCCDCKRERIVHGDLTVQHEFIHLICRMRVVFVHDCEDRAKAIGGLRVSANGFYGRIRDEGANCVVVFAHLVEFCKIGVGAYEFRDLLPDDIRLLLLCRSAIDAPMLISREGRVIVAHLPGEKRFSILPPELDVALTETTKAGTLLAPSEQTSDDEILKAARCKT